MMSPFAMLSRRFALAALLPLTPLAGANAAPVTGSGQPIPVVQPTLGLNYIVRTSDPTNIADVGQVDLFAGNFAPGGWALANGQQLSIATNQVLFSQIGTLYGGNGFTTFDLPNLNGRVAIGAGQGTGLSNQPLGNASGSNTQTLTQGELPPFGGANGASSGSTPVPIRQASLALNYGVVTQGFFPTSGGQLAPGLLLGQVVSYAGPTAPAGILPANGQPVSIIQNPALFSVLGTTYGGNGIATFDLPNLQGRAPTESGQAPGLLPERLGEATGAEQVLLTTADLPPHRLTRPNGTTSTFGGGQPFSIAQPSIGLHAIIDLDGTFPTQGTITGDETPFLGEISWFAGTFAPFGWAFADGQLLSIEQNPALFSILGTTYGGNGITDFALTDLQDRLAIGATIGLPLGAPEGSATDTLTYAQLPLGYPATLPAISAVPEPRSATIIALAAAILMLASRLTRRGRTSNACPGEVVTP
jgi:microcystin-dependent protein